MKRTAEPVFRVRGLTKTYRSGEVEVDASASASTTSR